MTQAFPKLLLLIVTLLLLTTTEVSHAEDLGAFEGAVWRFSLTPKNPQIQELRGVFRVHDGVIYQWVDPKVRDTEKVAGSETAVRTPGAPKAKRTRLEFTNLRAFSVKRTPGGERDFTSGMQGTVLMRMEKPGKWSGAFIAKDGRHWKFSCMRIRE